jgi:hypothetical protein
MAKKMYVEGGKKTKTVPGVKVARPGYMHGTKAGAAKSSTCRVNGISNLYVKRPHSVG